MSDRFFSAVLHWDRAAVPSTARAPPTRTRRAPTTTASVTTPTTARASTTPRQVDQDDDGLGDAYDADIDGDGIPDGSDGYPSRRMEH